MVQARSTEFFAKNSLDARTDLVGANLDSLVNILRGVQLLVIDEISTVGAAPFEIISRRLEQVGKVLWRERFGTAPPDELGGFGGIGVVCMGDFAQLPPVLSSMLLTGSPIQDAKSSGLRTLALTGRQRFQHFQDVIRLRRIHRIQGADPYKESTMRLRDASITLDDYKLWKQHEIDSLDVPSAISWTEKGNSTQGSLVLSGGQCPGGSHQRPTIGFHRSVYRRASS